MWFEIVYALPVVSYIYNVSVFANQMAFGCLCSDVLRCEDLGWFEMWMYLGVYDAMLSSSSAMFFDSFLASISILFELFVYNSVFSSNFLGSQISSICLG